MNTAAKIACSWSVCSSRWSRWLRTRASRPFILVAKGFIDSWMASSARAGGRGQTERRVQSLDHAQHFRPGNPVIDIRPVPARADDAIRSQPHQLLRQRHLPDAELLAELGDGFFLSPQGAKRKQTLWMRQAAHQFGGLFGGGNHGDHIHSLEFKIFEC